MKPVSFATMLGGFAVAAILAGCGGEGDKEDDNPTAAELAAFSKSAAALDAAGRIAKIASAQIMADGTGGATERGSELPGAKAPRATISFQNTVNLTVDLDVLGIGGADKYPNATGVFDVVATGSVGGDELVGSVVYNVTITRVTDIVFTDPDTGAQARFFSGPGLVFDLTLSWQKTDNSNWSVTVDFEARRDTALPLEITSGGRTCNAWFTGRRHETGTVGATGGVLFVEYDIEGFREVTFTDGAETHTVRADVESLSIITITIDGNVYGPYTAWELLAHFGVATN